jgi:hypothetical protein
LNIFGVREILILIFVIGIEVVGNILVQVSTSDRPNNRERGGRWVCTIQNKKIESHSIKTDQ